MNRLLAPALLLALPMPAWAADAPSAKLSGPKAVEVGAAIILNPTGSVGDVEFGLASGPGPAPIIRLKSDDGGTVIGFGTAAVPGTYVFVCTAWGEPVDKGRPAHSFAFWTVQVGQPAPPPDPTPPNPIDPPGPVDAALLSSLQAAYNADAGADKATSLKFLKAAYKGMAANPRAGLATNADAFAWMKSVVEAPGVGLADTQLVAVRRAVAARLIAAFGATPAVPLDAAKFKAELTTISNALARVK